jgi:hypothetical protein
MQTFIRAMSRTNQSERALSLLPTIIAAGVHIDTQMYHSLLRCVVQLRGNYFSPRHSLHVCSRHQSAYLCFVAVSVTPPSIDIPSIYEFVDHMRDIDFPPTPSTFNEIAIGLMFHCVEIRKDGSSSTDFAAVRKQLMRAAVEAQRIQPMKYGMVSTRVRSHFRFALIFPIVSFI